MCTKLFSNYCGDGLCLNVCDFRQYSVFERVRERAPEAQLAQDVSVRRVAETVQHELYASRFDAERRTADRQCHHSIEGKNFFYLNSMRLILHTEFYLVIWFDRFVFTFCQKNFKNLITSIFLSQNVLSSQLLQKKFYLSDISIIFNCTLKYCRR